MWPADRACAFPPSGAHLVWPGCERTIRWRSDGGATVAIRLKGRLWVQVLADMVEGVVAANGLQGPEADQARTALWASVEGGGLQAA